MRSIRHRFDAFEKTQPSHSTFINFSMSVCGKHYNPERIRHAFNKLVDKEDYAPEEKRALLQWLYSHTKCAEAYRIRGEKSPKKSAKTKQVSKGV